MRALWAIKAINARSMKMRISTWGGVEREIEERRGGK